MDKNLRKVSSEEIETVKQYLSSNIEILSNTLRRIRGGENSIQTQMGEWKRMMFHYVSLIILSILVMIILLIADNFGFFPLNTKYNPLNVRFGIWVSLFFVCWYYYIDFISLFHKYRRFKGFSLYVYQIEAQLQTYIQTLIEIPLIIAELESNLCDEINVKSIQPIDIGFLTSTAQSVSEELYDYQTLRKNTITISLILLFLLALLQIEAFSYLFVVILLSAMFMTSKYKIAPFLIFALFSLLAFLSS